MAISSDDPTGDVRLRRVTSDYIAVEDRIRLTGEADHGHTVVLWLTQRLLGRLVPHLLGWLERQPEAQPGEGVRNDPSAGIRQGFAQQAAVASLTPQPAISPNAKSLALLVHEVNISASPRSIRLTFRSTEAEGAKPAVLILPPLTLRQWIDVLYRLYQKAGWPGDFWPDWLMESRTAPVPAPTLLH